jgi:hypothetical protein
MHNWTQFRGCCTWLIGLTPMLADSIYDSCMSFFPLSKCRYEQIKLVSLKHAKISKEGMITKSSIMLGLRESDDELKEAIVDLGAIDVDNLNF